VKCLLPGLILFVTNEIYQFFSDDSGDEEATAEYALVSNEKTPQSWLTDYLPPGSLPDTNTSSKKPAQEDNAMNKSVTNLWNMHKSSPGQSGNASPVIASGAATPVGVSTPINEELPIIPAAAASTAAAATATATTTAPTAPAPTKDESGKSKKRSKNSKDSGSSAKRPKSKS
jgi:hypothetical protein